MMTASNLLRWNQFVLGPQFLEGFPDWQKISLTNSLCLTTHPNLHICHRGQGAKWIALIGFILDPENPDASDEAIVEQLLLSLGRFSEFLDHLDRLGGRWTLIACDGATTKLFHDACGARQIFYSAIHLPRWCATQPELIGDVLHLQIDEEADDFITLQLARGDPEAWWPGDRCAYADIRRLLPNHYLDLETGRAHRYWPRKDRTPISFAQGLDSVGRTLRGTLTAAAMRFDLSLSLSAGYDSRCILAASRGIVDRIALNTLAELQGRDSNAVDLTVVGRLVARLGCKLDLVQEQLNVDRSFLALYFASSKFPHMWHYPEAQAYHQLYRNQKVRVTGHLSEVGRCFYGQAITTDLRNAGKTLARSTGMGWQPFAIRHFQNWYDRLGDTKGFSPLDLFYWEQRAGSWLAAVHSEFDMGSKDILMPFNCRAALADMLRVDELKRCRPYYRFHRQLIATMWPELLAEPINALSHPSLRRRIRSRLSAVKQSMRRFAASVKRSSGS
jgi:hypothetical protein